MPRRLVPFLFLFALALPSTALAQGFHALHSWDGVDVWAVGDAGTYYRSFDRGATWTSGTLGDKTLRAVAAVGFNVVVVGDSGKVWHSTDSGGTWNLNVIPGIPGLRGLAMTSDLVGYAVGSGGTILKTIDGGGSWTPQTSGTANALNAVRFTDTLHGIAVGDGGTALRTLDGGANWLPVNGLNSTAALYGVDVSGATVWIVGAEGTARRSINDGADWTIVNLKLDVPRPDVRVVSLRSPDVVVIAGGGGFIRTSVDNGATWTFPIHPMHGQIAALYFAGGRAWACSNRNRALLVSPDNGATWDLPAGTLVSRSWSFKLPFGGNIRGSTFGQNPVYRSTLYAALGNTIYRSRDDGESWLPMLTLPISGAALNAFIISPKDTLKMMVAVNLPSPKRIMRTVDGGVNWTTPLTHNFGDFGIPLQIHPDCPDTVYFGGDNDGLFRSIDFGATWLEISTPNFRSPCDIVVVPDSSSIILVGDGVTGSGQAEYWRSLNGGLTFALEATRPIGATEIPGLACTRLRNSTTFGTNWGSGGVQRSTDYGDTWPLVSTVGSSWGIDIARDDPNCVMFGVYSGGATYLSLDGGNIFTATPLTGTNYSFYLRDRATIFAEQANGIWKLDTSYPYTPSAAHSVTVTAPNGGEVWRANTSHNVTWTSQNLAMARIEYRRSAADPWQFIADVPGYENGYMWIVPNDLTTEAELRIQDPSDADPSDQSDAVFTIDAAPLAVGDRTVDFAVWQNQPNPFNRVTRIHYALPVAAPVSLEVFDLSGHRVASLVSEIQGPGEFSVPFGAGVATATGGHVGTLAAGMYFYRFEAGGFARTRKMLVLK